MSRGSLYRRVRCASKMKRAKMHVKVIASAAIKCQFLNCSFDMTKTDYGKILENIINMNHFQII
jgi:hypothetical protein